ncbi:MAG TPA: hypothetical protein V6D17_00035 [Candidatus Obscuribacterales bacterium]
MHGVKLGGRGSFISDATKQKHLIESVIQPVLKRFGNERQVLAWEVINEPEWAMRIHRGKNSTQWQIPRETMQGFVKEVVRTIHALARQPATVGSAARHWLGLWQGCNLDIYQFHYYPNHESRSPLASPAARLGLSEPVVVGEFPTKSTSRSAQKHLEIVSAHGYAGALAWSMRGNDRYSDFQKAAKSMKEWREKRARKTP